MLTLSSSSLYTLFMSWVMAVATPTVAIFVPSLFSMVGAVTPLALSGYLGGMALLGSPLLALLGSPLLSSAPLLGSPLPSIDFLIDFLNEVVVNQQNGSSY